MMTQGPPGVPAYDAQLVARLRSKLQWPDWDERAPTCPPPLPSAKASGRPAPDITKTVERCLARARLLREGGAYVRLEAEAVLRAARLGARPSGRLDRYVVAVKDLVAIAGLPLGAGSQLRSDAPPEPNDAWVVAAVRAAGGIVLGTTALHEFAFGVTGVNDVIGFPSHPSDASRVPGGSSSGSAVAVAEGSARLAIGTDTGGSVRIPAALCGVVGFKPAYGTYPLHGVFPLAPTLDHLGIHARSVREGITAHATFTGRSVRARPASRIGLDRRALDDAEPDVAAAVTRLVPLLERAGCCVVDVDWPEPERVFEVSTAIMFAEAAAVHHRRLKDLSIFGRDVAARLVTGSALAATTYVAARRDRDVIMSEVASVLEGLDCVLGPTVPVVAPTIAEVRKKPQLAARLVAHTRLANLAGVPALTMPLPTEGLPVGAQLVGNHNERVLATARFLETLVTFELVGLGRRRHST